MEEKEDQLAKGSEIRYDDGALFAEMQKMHKSNRDMLRHIDHRIDMVMAILGMSIFINLLNLVI